jgi:Glycosyltransferase family 20
MWEADGVWVGWSGDAEPAPGAFEANGLDLVAVGLSAEQVRDYYEGFCNATLWPLYHDVITAPQFERRWWEAYAAVNRSCCQRRPSSALPACPLIVVILVRDRRGGTVAFHASRPVGLPGGAGPRGPWIRYGSDALTAAGVGWLRLAGGAGCCAVAVWTQQFVEQGPVPQ